MNLHTSGLRRRRLEREWLAREGATSARRVSSQPDVGARQDLWKALGELPPRQRAALVLRYYEDLSEREIAEALGMAPGTVKSNAHAAQRRLADILGEPTVETVEGAQP